MKQEDWKFKQKYEPLIDENEKPPPARPIDLTGPRRPLRSNKPEEERKDEEPDAPS
jgi:hypothetical protein